MNLMPRFLNSRIELAGWVLATVSVGLLGMRYWKSRDSSAPSAESRKTAVQPPPTSGAWWFQGTPPPPGPPDLTGVWFGGAQGDVSKAVVAGQELVFTPFGKQRFETVDHAQNPTNFCLPPGPVRIQLMMLPVMIVQRPDVVVLLSEFQRTYRLIYTDGRRHDPEAKDYPEWMGDSIGHWENDTLVVDTVSTNDRSWLDMIGHEHSDQLHLIERFRLLDAETIEHLTTFEDPVYFTKPFTTRKLMKRQIGDRILDNACGENEKDLKNLVPTIGAEGR